MTSTTISRSLIATLLLTGVGATAASAEQPSSLKEWQAAADKSISKAMSVPSLTNRHGIKGYAQFTVTVNREGDVIGSAQTIRAGNNGLNNSALRAVHRANFPALPDSYTAEQLTFTLNMDYRSSEGFAGKRRFRKGNVSSTEISSGN